MKAIIDENFKVVIKNDILGAVEREASCDGRYVCVSRINGRHQDEVFINIEMPLDHAECAVIRQNEQAEQQAIENNRPIDRYKIKELALKELIIDGNSANLYFWFVDCDGDNRIYHGITCTIKQKADGEYILTYREPIFYF